MKPFSSNYSEYDCYWIYKANTLLLNLFIFKEKKKFLWVLEVLSNLVEELSLNNTFLVFMCIFEAHYSVNDFKRIHLVVVFKLKTFYRHGKCFVRKTEKMTELTVTTVFAARFKD